MHTRGVRSLSPFLALIVPFVVGCTKDAPKEVSTSSTSTTSTTSGMGGTGGMGGSGPMYGACPDGYLTECATIQVPLDHQSPTGETIDFHFSRIPAAVQPAKRQVWVLAGGPGQAGYVFHSIIADLASRMPDADVFVPDHRGTGYSHRLTCPQQDVANSYGGYSLDPTKGDACLQTLKASGDYDKLAHFTATEAARDLLDGIAAARTSADEKVYVWGGSYGTHWAHRTLQLAADKLDGFIFDGFMTPNHFSFLNYDHAAEEAGDALAAACDKDASCTAHIGPGGALAKVQSVLAGLETKPCGAFTRDLARTWLSLLVDHWFGRENVFPMVHRLERCSATDLDALYALVDYENTTLTAAYNVPFVNSGVLQDNIVLSELWATPGETIPTKAELLASANAQTWLAGSSLPGGLVDLRTTWPLPPADGASLPVPVPTTTPMLWLGAAIDAHTYKSQGDQISLVYPNAPYILLKDASHVPSEASPMNANHNEMCGTEIVTSFIESSGVPDTSCEAGMLPALLEAPDALSATKYWGTADDWGDGTPKPIASESASWNAASSRYAVGVSPSELHAWRAALATLPALEVGRAARR